MTCVAAMVGSMHGGLFGADTRASWQDGRRVDGVQKIFPVATHTMLGYAGSCRLGFRAAAMAQRLGLPQQPLRHPRVLAEPLALKLRSAWTTEWSSSEPDLTSLGLSILIVGHVPGPPDADIPSLMTDGYMMRAPDFALDRLEPNRFIVIGSARNAPSFISSFEQDDWEPFLARWVNLRFGEQTPGHFILRKAFGDALQAAGGSTSDIGPEVQTWSINYEGCHYRGSRALVMQSWDEFQALAAEAGVDPASAFGQAGKAEAGRVV